jgi:hypothetical protein
VICPFLHTIGLFSIKSSVAVVGESNNNELDQVGRKPSVREAFVRSNG